MKYDKSLKKDIDIIKSIKAILTGLFISVLVSVVLLVISSFLFVKVKNIPSASVMPLAIVISAVGSFLGAYVTGRILRMNGLIYGAIVGISFFVLLFISSLIIAREPLSILTLIKFALLTFTGAIGGVVAVNKRKS